MANLDKLNKTIDELENQSRQMKEIGDVFSELKTFYDSLDQIKSEQEKLSKKYQTSKKALDKSTNDTLQSLEQHAIQIKELNDMQRDINASLLNNVKEVSDENTKLYMDQKKYIDNKLELAFGELQTQNIKTKNEFLETINKLDNKITQLEIDFQDNQVKNKQEQKNNRILLISTLGVSTISLLLNLFM